MRRLGILGGTFDPVHVGHLDAADAARGTLGLDGVLFIPAHDPPHKPIDPRASAFHRFAMVALALEGRDGDRLSDIELRRSGPSYTIATLRALHADGWAPAELFFIIGTDAFADIETWYEYPAVLDCANFAVIERREGDAGRLRQSGSATAGRGSLEPVGRGSRGSPAVTDVYHVEASTRDVSSTAIRSRLAAGQPIDDMVPARVARYIRTHHLYGA